MFPPETIAKVYRHSRGIPRLINTVCENALITAFARQAPIVEPEVIDEVAADFRLGVVRRNAGNGNGMAAEPGGLNRRPIAESSEEVWQAVKTLLQLHDYLQNVKSSEGEAPLEVGPESRRK